MSVMLMGSSGQPSARAMASGIPNTTGVRVKDSGSPTSAGEAAAATRSVHTVEAGDHSVGHSSGLSLGQSPPAVRYRVASPDDTLTGRMVAHSSSAFASADSLNAAARASSMLTFSDDVATATWVHPSSAKSPSPDSPSSGPGAVQPATASAATISAAPKPIPRRPDGVQRRPVAVRARLRGRGPMGTA
jgi:hypothetical protein